MAHIKDEQTRINIIMESEIRNDIKKVVSEHSEKLKKIL